MINPLLERRHEPRIASPLLLTIDELEVMFYCCSERAGDAPVPERHACAQDEASRHVECRARRWHLVADLLGYAAFFAMLFHTIWAAL